jgi:hypothetical protein
MHINDLLKIASERKASDLHLKVGSHPVLRINGDLVPLVENKRLMQEDTIAMAFSIMSNRQKQKFKDNLEIDIAYSVPASAASAATSSSSAGRWAWCCASSREDHDRARAGLPIVLEKICNEQRGLILCTGTTGSGKSTSLAAMIDYINSQRTEHVITIEDPIEFLHRDKKSIVNQREVEVDTRSFAAACAPPAPGPRRHPGRRDARLRDDRDRHHRRRDRPPGALHAAHPGRHRDHQPHHLRLPAPPAEADPPAAVGVLKASSPCAWCRGPTATAACPRSRS